MTSSEYLNRMFEITETILKQNTYLEVPIISNKFDKSKLEWVTLIKMQIGTNYWDVEITGTFCFAFAINDQPRENVKISHKFSLYLLNNIIFPFQNKSVKEIPN